MTEADNSNERNSYAGEVDGKQLGRRAAVGARWSIFGQWSRFGCQILAILILARILTPESYGLFGIVAAIAGFATVIGDFGLSSAAIQAKTISDRQKTNLLWINAAIGTVSAIILATLADPLGNYFDNAIITSITYAMSFNFILVSLTTQFAANITRDLRFKLLFAADLLGPGLGLIAAILFALGGAGVWSLVAQQLVCNLVILVILSLRGGWLPGLPSKVPMSHFLKFGLFTFLVQVLTYASASLSSLLIGRSHSVGDVGIFDRARQINAIPSTQLSTPLARVMLPILARVQNDPIQLSSYLAKVQNLMAYVIGAIMVFLAVLSQPIVIVVLGPGWEEVAPVLSILSLGGFFTAMGFVLQWGFMATGRVGLQLSFSVFTRSVMILMLIIAAPYGLQSIAAASSLGLALNWIILYLFALPRTSISTRLLWLPFLRPLSVHISVASLAYLANWVLRFSPLGQSSKWLILAGVLLLSYILIFTVLRPIRTDIVKIWSVVSRKGI